MENYLGMRVESVDEVEILRRMEEGIYDQERVRARAGLDEGTLQGRPGRQPRILSLATPDQAREQKEKQWEFTIKMYCIISDLMQRQSQSARESFVEETVGHNAIAAGFQGQRQWTDHWPNCDYPEAVLNSSL